MSQQKLFFHENVKVIPSNYIIFQCEDDQPIGQIRISIIPIKTKQKDLQQFQFQLMATNKVNYKVSNTKGVINSLKKTALIRIYIKNTQNLEKCLSDKFRLRISDKKTNSFIDYKLKVLIQKQVTNSKQDDQNANSTHTVTKSGISLYTSPSILTSTASSDLRSILYLGESIVKRENKSKIAPVLNSSQLVQTKQGFDDSTHYLNKKKKQLQIVQDALRKQKASKRMRKNTVPSFIQKTWQILQEGQYNNILKWSTDGSSFQILDQNSFCLEVLPKYFKHSNFSSFIRQLNMYNFHKKKTTDISMEFYHKLFRKNMKQLLIGIKRKPSQAEIQYGDQLIRKMNKETTYKPPSRQSSHSDQNFDIHRHQHGLGQQKQRCRQSFCQPLCVQPMNQMVFYHFWPNMNPPLQQSNRQNLSNCNIQTKIITNIIIKNPPNDQLQSEEYPMF